MPMTWWLRAYLVFASVQGIGIGLTGMLLPPEMQIPLRISPLNARFVAALYLAGGIGTLLAAFARRRSEVRIFVIGFGLATGMILVLTIAHWAEFMADPLPHRAVWIFDYVTDPALAVLVVPLARLWPTRLGVRHALSPLFVVQAAVFALLGGLLVLVPDAVATVWPWVLPPLLGQLYGCFFLTYALGAALAARDTEARAISIFMASTLALMLLVLVASVLHIDRFKPEPVTWVWFAAFGLGAVVFAAALARRQFAR
jgi:hypothetical protein